MTGDMPVRSAMDSVMAEPQRAVVTPPEGEGWIARAQHSLLAALKMDRQRARRLSRILHGPTVNAALPGWPPAARVAL